MASVRSLSSLYALCASWAPRYSCVMPTQFRGGKLLLLAERLATLDSVLLDVERSHCLLRSTSSSRNFFA